MWLQEMPIFAIERDEKQELVNRAKTSLGNSTSSLAAAFEMR
jgi:hypothetical protein